MFVLETVLRELDPIEIYVVAARIGTERVSFEQCARELSESRGTKFNRKQVERIYTRAESRIRAKFEFTLAEDLAS